MLNQGTITYKAVIEKMQRDTGFTQFYEDECKCNAVRRSLEQLQL